METCIECQGVGFHLVNAKYNTCIHCARKNRTGFNPNDCVYTKQEGFVDISPNADGGILKLILKYGNPGTIVREGCPTKVQYVGRLEDGSIFDTTRDVVDGKHVGGTDDLFEFKLGRGEVVKGFDFGVSSMGRGEVARFLIQPKYGYGKEGFAPHVEPDAVLDFEIELVSFGDSLPKFPSQAELAKSKAKRLEEQEKMLAENPPPSIDERVLEAVKEKELGNKMIQEGNYERAKEHYDSGFVNIYIGKDEWQHMVSEEEKQKIHAIKLPLYLNRALCKLKLNKFNDALWDCDQAIEIDENAVKAHYRRLQSYIGKLKMELEKEEKKEFWVMDKAFEYVHQAEISLAKVNTLNQTKVGNHELMKCKQLLLKYDRQYKLDQKILYKDKIMDKLIEKNQKSNTPKSTQNEYLDMPPLE